jgi:HrpA-like RNA helicase
LPRAPPPPPPHPNPHPATPQAELIEGDVDDDDAMTARERERAARLAAIEDERARMQAERKELPIYPWRQEFLDAVAAHQVGGGVGWGGKLGGDKK